MSVASRPTSDPAATEPFKALFAAEQARLPGSELPWLTQLRQTALAAAAAKGLPTQQAEAWRKTSLRVLGKQHYLLPQASGAGIDSAPHFLNDADRVVFVDGLQRRDLSSAGAATGLATLADLLHQAPDVLRTPLAAEAPADALSALNLALFQDGVRLSLDAGRSLPRPIELTFLNGLAETALTAHPRLQIDLAEGASAVIVEQHRGLGDAPRFMNHAARIALGPGARLVHLVLLAEGAETTHLADTHVSVAEGAAYESYVLFAGGQLCRRAVTIALQGRKAQALVNGGYLLTGRQQGDLTTRILHCAPDSVSRSTVKGALAGEARQVFQGCIEVAAGSARADGRLSNKTLLLSDRAEIDSKPELRIFHDEVQCAHGATSGKLDEAALFYLRSRGLPLAEARRLLIGSFLAETLEGFGETVALPLSQAIEARLQEIVS